MFNRKHKNILRGAPTELWLKKSFDFIVPDSLEDYCSYIETFDEGFFSSYRVYLTSLDQKRIAFNVSRRAGNSGTVWVVGYLEAVEAQSTHIVGKAGVPPFDLLLTILIIGIVGCVGILGTIVSSGLGGGCFIALFVIFLGAIIWASLWWTRDGLINKLKHK